MSLTGAVEERAPLTVRAAGLSDTGRTRDHNEDAFLLRRLTGGGPPEGGSTTASSDREGLLLAVCDGMGGAAAGERASALVAATLAERIGHARALSEPADLAGWLDASILEADRRILDAAAADPTLQGMGSTITAALITEGVILVSHVGDSRAYHLRSGRLRQLTVDQSFVGELVAMGRLTLEDARNHESRNVLLQALGSGKPIEVDRVSVPLHDGDRILLCSDGLYGLLSDEELNEAIGAAGDPAELCRELVSLANERGGSDNITVLAAHVN